MMADLLSARELTFAYGQTPVLRDLGIDLAPGEVLTLLGPNGSGKSTLIKVLLGHLRGSGRIEWEGRAIESWRKRDLTRIVAYLPQSPSWEAQQTVLDVLRQGRAPYWGAFGVESPRDAEVVTATSSMLELDDLLSRPMDQLSGGQRQRVFLGRCLAQQPKAMLLDEPSTFLDLRHQVELLRLLRQLARERHIGVLMASHDLNLAGRFADRLTLLHQGRIVASGSAEEVLRPEILERVYQVPMQRLEGQGGKPVVIPAVGD
jgi:iron complex transport system ATP-binding protein